MSARGFLPVSSTKSALIDFLSREHPLSAKEIFHRIQKVHSSPITYQAVHKSLGELVDEKVLVKEGPSYSLDPLWIHGLKSFALDLSETYSRKGKVDLSKDHITLRFSTLLSMLRFIVGLYESRFPNPDKKDSICVWQHPWPVIGFSEVEFAHLRKLLHSSTHYAVTPNDTPLDRMFATMLQEMGKHCRNGVNIEEECDIKIHGDYVAQIFFPEELKRELDDIYRNTDKTESLQYAKLLRHVMDHTYDIVVVVQRNPALANHYRRMVKGLF